MSTKHTPGPWSLHEYMGGCTETDCRSDDGTFGFVAHTAYIGAGPVLIGQFEAYRHVDDGDHGHPRVTDFDVNRANARLAIAAPVMLAALRRAALALSFAAESSPAMRDDYEAVRAAIAAATGEA